MKSLERNTSLAVAFSILSMVTGCKDIAVQETRKSVQHDSFSVIRCSGVAANTSERCHARGLAGPKDCYGSIRNEAFEECMKEK